MCVVGSFARKSQQLVPEQNSLFTEALFQVFKAVDFFECLKIFVAPSGSFCPIESVEGQNAARNFRYALQS